MAILLCPMLFDHESAWTDAKIYEMIYANSIAFPDEFWRYHARDLVWKTEPKSIFCEQRNSWLEGGISNVCFNCVDRHALATPNKPALIWYGDEPCERTEMSYSELLDRIICIASFLRKSGITVGDIVCIHMPMIPDAIAAMLACARIGALHLVVFTGFSSSALAYRIKSSNAKMILTIHSIKRGGRKIDIMKNAEDAVATLEVPVSVVALEDIDMFKSDEGREIEWHDHRSDLFVLYTSGTSGSPKGIIHSALPYILYVATTFKVIFGIEQDDVYFCTSDIGWITGHSYIAYAPLFHGLTVVMFSGNLTYPTADRYWSIIESENVSIFYSSPTAFRTLQMFNKDFVTLHDLASLRVLGSVGEPIDTASWKWYFETIGQKRCPIIDSWWQTETGGIVLAPLRNLDQKPGIAGKPFFGIKPKIVYNDEDSALGQLALTNRWPGLCRSVMYECKYVEQLDSSFCTNVFEKMYFQNDVFMTGDAASYDDDNSNIKVMGRLDDVLNISGHRLGTTEFEDAINGLDEVVESAVIGIRHAIKGQAVFVYVVAKRQDADYREIARQIVHSVKMHIGPIAKPDFIAFINAMPKNNSGKIVRSVLKRIANREECTESDFISVTNRCIVKALQNAVNNAMECPDSCFMEPSI